MIYCGIDGGGTKTKIIIANNQKVITTLITGPSSIDTVSIDEAILKIRIGLAQIYSEYDIAKIDSIFLGLGGIASNEQSDIINKKILELPFFNENAIINSANDIMNAYLSSCSGRNNITVIIGTGAVAYGEDEDGKSHRTNGIHFLEGDFGGAYDVGVKFSH